MRIPVFLTCLLAVVLAALPVRHAKADDVSFDVFYNNLADDGDWYNTPEYGYVWHPTVADKSEKWRPYTDGYWAQTDDGWTWVSYENFGWATYHYGRWTRLKDIGWSWVPGYDWGPGWVSWRTSEDHVGWAPLPPRADQGVEEEDRTEGRPEARPEGRRPERHRSVEVDYNTVEPADYGPDVDNQYDIGPDNYCFVETRHFGAPVLAEVIEPPQRNVVIIERTINVTNIYRPAGGPRGPGGGFAVYNRGPDYNFLNAHCERPIQVLRIERHEDVVFLNNGIHGGGNANQVRNGVFAVAAPPIRRAPVNFAQLKPVRVKQTVERTEIVHGWSKSGADPATVQRLRQQFKQQAQQATPPPREAEPPRPEALVRARAEAANQPPAPANPANKPGQQPPGPVNPANKPDHQPPAANPANPPNKPGQPPLTDEQRAARREARQKAKAAAGSPAPAPAQPTPPAPPAPGGNGQGGLTPEERQAKREQRQQAKAKQQGQQPPVLSPAAGQSAPPAATPPAPNPDREARRAQRQQEKAQQKAQQDQPQAQPPAPPQPDADREARRAQRQQEKAQQQQQQPQAQPGNAPAQDNPDRDARRAQRQQEKAQQQQQVAPQGGQPANAPAQGNPDRDARRAQRQQAQQQPQQQQQQPQPRAQQSQPQAQPRPQQQQGTPQGKGDDDKKKKKDQGNQ